ncbi:toxin biosynthesis protein [Lojkania enalia]|uniref:Toxin biosynthesis protein n=1 Tax=Lojkania enalia TaxID=147567 RepID=A0A9P4KEK2_9PLEO|nr:toxin biosynthesis protein [Didymosphaeria enalia]
MAASMPNTTLREPDASIIPHASLYICQLLALAGPRFRGRALIFSVMIIGLAIQAHLHPHFTNNPGLAQPFTIAWSYYMGTLAKLLFSKNHNPEESFWRIDRPEQEAMSYMAFGPKKIRWAIMLIFNQRGIRWNHEVKNVPKQEPQSKAYFLFSQLLRFIKCMLVADLLFVLSRRLFFTSPDGQVGQVNSKFLTLRHPSPVWSFAKTFVFACTPYYMLSMQYAQFAFLAVLLGLSKPEDWPSPFGKLHEITTLRDFWGKFWHQQLRHMLTSYVDAFADFLGIPKGTNLSSYTKLYLSFLMSGFFHAFSQLQMPSPVNITAEERVVPVFQFFVWQAALITVEDFFQWLARKGPIGALRAENTRLRAWIGYVWLLGTLWATVPLAGDTFLKMRMGLEPMLPFSLSGPLVEAWVPVPP